MSGVAPQNSTGLSEGGRGGGGKIKSIQSFCRKLSRALTAYPSQYPNALLQNHLLVQFFPLPEIPAHSAREWVKDALGNGGLCWVEEANFRNTVDVLLRQAPHELAVVPRFVFATSDDAHFLEATKHGNMVPVFTLDDVSLPAYAAGRQHFGGYSNGSKETSASAAGQSITADEVSAALPAIDVAVCSRAALLMLNYFSTYSALIKAKAKAQPDFVRGLYWADPPALSNWWLQFRAWLRKKFRSS